MNMAELTKSKRKDQYKKAGTAYVRAMKTAEKAPGDVQRETRERFLLEYGEVLDYYKMDGELKDEKISGDFQLLLEAYENAQAASAAVSAMPAEASAAPSSATGGGGILGGTTRSAIRRGLQQGGETPMEEPAERSNENITPAQREGLKNISRWLLRNMEKHGVTGDSKSAFVLDYVLKQSDRVKLCAYYLVETESKGLSGDALREAISKSQAPDYVPDLDRFKEKMISSKFAFWRRVTGGTFHWSDLAEAMRFAVSQQALISKFGMSETDANGGGIAGEGSRASGTGSGGNVSSGIVSQHQELLELREKIAYLVGIQAVDTLTQNQQDTLSQNLTDFLEKAKVLVQEIESTEGGSHSAEDGKISGFGEVEDNIDQVAGDGGDLVGLIKDFLGKMSGASTLGEIGDWMNIIAGVNAVATAITGVVELLVKGSYLTIGEKSDKIASLLSSLAKVGTAGASMYEKFSGAELGALGGGGSIASGILDFAGGAISIVHGRTEKNSLASSQRAIMSNATVSEQDKAMTQKAASLRRRQLDTQQVTGGMKMLSGGLQIASGVLSLTGVAEPVAVILQAVAMGVNLASSIYAFHRKRGNIRETIDDYINMGQIYSIVVSEINKMLIQQHQIDGKPVTAPSPDELKHHIRLEAAALMGCYSLSDFYNYITRIYATVIYNNAMLKSDGTPVENATELSQKNLQYIEMLSAYGLKPNFQKGKPSVDTIQKAMAD